MDEQTLMLKSDKFIAVKMADDNNEAADNRELILQGLVKPLITATVSKT